MPNVYIHYFQCTNTLIRSITMTNVTSYDIFWSINCFIVSILSVSSHFIFKQILYYFQNSTEMMWIMSYITTFYFLNPPLIFTNSLLVLSYPTLITRIFNDLHDVYTDPVSNVVKKLYVILPFRLNPVTVEIKKNTASSSCTAFYHTGRKYRLLAGQLKWLNLPCMQPELSFTTTTRLLDTPKRVTTKHVCPTSEICQEKKIKTK